MSKRTLAYGLTLALSASFAMAALVEAAPALTPRQIYKTYGKGVVLVFATDGSAQGSAGTGSIITKDGQIITNAHVISTDGRPYKKVFVYLKPDKLKGSMKDDLTLRFKATVVDIDPNLDLALLKMVDAPPDLTTISFVNPDDVEIGEPVVAIGHPETGGLWTLTTGSISSLVADFQGVPGKDVFQTEASVNRGNSGGPLLNAYGHMVGINTCISRKAADGLAITDINFSLKSSVTVDWMKRRKLMTLAYVAPNTVDSDVAPEVKSVVVASKGEPKKDVIKVDAGDGKTLVAVVEPDRDQIVADDPEFAAAAAAESQTVSRGMKNGKKPPPKAKPKADDRVQPKQLTKAHPYEIDAFVSDRVKEIRDLEKMMDDMSRRIDEKSGKKKKKKYGDGMGLW